MMKWKYCILCTCDDEIRSLEYSTAIQVIRERAAIIKTEAEMNEQSWINAFEIVPMNNTLQNNLPQAMYSIDGCFDVCKELIGATLKKNKVNKPSSFQAHVWPVLLRGHNWRWPGKMRKNVGLRDLYFLFFRKSVEYLVLNKFVMLVIRNGEPLFCQFLYSTQKLQRLTICKSYS